MNNWIRRSVQVGTVSASIVLAAATVAVAQAPQHHAGRLAGKVGIDHQMGLVASTTGMTPSGTPRDSTDTDPGIPAGATPGILRRPVNTNPGTPAGAKAYDQNATSPQVPATAPTVAPTNATAPVSAGTPTSAPQPNAPTTAVQPTTGSAPVGGARPITVGRPIVIRPIIIGDDDFDTDFDDFEFVSFRHRYPGWRSCFGGRSFRWHHSWCGHFDRFGFRGDCGCDDDFGRGFGYRRFEDDFGFSNRGFS